MLSDVKEYIQIFNVFLVKLKKSINLFPFATDGKNKTSYNLISLIIY